MPKNNQNGLNISEYLKSLEDVIVFTHKIKSRTKCFEGLKSIFDEGSIVTPTEVQRVLAVFIKCVKEDLVCIPYALSAITSLLTKAEIVPSVPAQDFIPSALAVLHIINTLCVGNTTQKIRELCFTLLLSYPADVLGELVTCNCSEILELFVVLKPQSNVGVEITKEPCLFLQKLLTILSSEPKKVLVKEGLSIWFSYLVPTVMTVVSQKSYESAKIFLECLETLTEVLFDIDYFTCPQWQDEILEGICNVKKYPLVIKELLLKGNVIWHRLWIVFIKMLKNQITRNFSTYGTPINSMLPVVEVAFKMDIASRCRAFLCWDSLIDNFSNETNENCLPKRIKLLLIPLKLNNAKSEETARAKCRTWWHFIRTFQFKLEKFTNEILITFLHFAFGKETTDKKPAIAGMGMAYPGGRNMCLEAFVQIVGHGNCDCCTEITKSNGKLMTNKLLANYWADWMYALKTAVEMASMSHEQCDNGNGSLQTKPMPILCIWKGFVSAVAELPPNGVRRDMFNGLIQVLFDLTKKCDDKESLSHILFSLTQYLFTNDNNIRNVLLSSKGEELPLQKVLSIVMNPGLSEIYKRYDTEKAIAALKPIADTTVESMATGWVLENLSPSDSSLKMWTVLAHSLKESTKDVASPKLLYKFLIWPVKAIHQLREDKCAAMAWYTMYNLSVKLLSKTTLEKDIYECVSKQEDNNNKCMKLYFTIGLLKNKLVNQKDSGVLPEIFQNLISQMSDYKEFEEAFPMLVDTIVIMLNTATGIENEKLAKMALNCVSNVLNMFISRMNSTDNEGSDPNDANIYKILQNIFNAVELLFKIPFYSDTNCDFVDQLRVHASSWKKETELFTFIISKMKSLVSNCSVETVKSKINDSVEMLKNGRDKSEDGVNTITSDSTDTNKIVKEFMSPEVNKPVKRAKKKETSVVNTVVENGEEYMVVKSNWKFNPRKLTENQKEKFQRKSEDIPALYQDLSQSQDEFKLSIWTTNSQDTTSSNSKSEKSTTNDDTINILKDVPSSDVVPKIMENLMSENDKKCTSEPKTNIEVAVCDLQTDKPKKVDRLSLSTPKNLSPRMALKDRVFRNVRNLIEKSTPNKNDANDVIIGECQIENVPKTPLVDKKNMGSLINAEDRPSRVKRKPRKFEDVELIPLKKKRNSAVHSNSPIDTDMDMLDKNMDNSQTTDITDNLDINNIAIEQKDLSKSVEVQLNEDITLTAEIKDSIHNVVESEVATVSQPTTDASVEPITKDECYNNQKNDRATDGEKNIVIEDEHRNENAELVHDDKITVDLNSETKKNEIIPVILKTPVNKTKVASSKSTMRKSRIEKELAIDTVEGHPFLKAQSEKRLTRTNKRKTFTEKINKTVNKTKKEIKFSPVARNKSKVSLTPSSSVSVEETQERSSSPEEVSTNDDAPCSEDVIESSQDSTLTTISVKSKRTPIRIPRVLVVCEKVDAILPNITNIGTQDLLNYTDCGTVANISVNQETKDDSELPQNKTAEIDKNQSELTENMDTQTVVDMNMSDDVIVLNDDNSQMILSSEKSVGPETQAFADADTQPNDPSYFEAFESIDISPNMIDISNIPVGVTVVTVDENAHICDLETQADDNEMSSEPNGPLTVSGDQDADTCSPFKDDVQRKQDFLNNTSEISPIKGQSPDKEQTPSPPRKGETSSDFVVVKLTSPVQSNGEPFDKCTSPEFFTEDKVSPDKRDQSPPRAEVSVNSGSPNSCLSLKKNRPQAMRPGGRAAHMLGLCVPDSLNTIKNLERVEPEEPKKANASTPARRNLRVLYNTTGENSDNLVENEEQNNFLMFKKVLPPTDCSPSVPILKRKLIDIVDDATASPASKRKRVSFHDPPVSTTVSVQKYIEPGGIKSPSSAQKRSERLLTRTYTKSPKRLENAFVKLDTVLFKAVESFSEDPVDSLTNDTNASLDVTPAVTVVNTSELNDTDPICPDLVECTDSIEKIATELSSPAMKELFIQELEGKVGTVGDLAKMTELEVNRLCIKAPKVQIAKKVLADYINKRAVSVEEVTENISLENDTALATEMNEEMTEEAEPMTLSVNTQTDKVSVCDTEMQTKMELVQLAETQTDIACTAHSSMQTEESGFRTTSAIIASCLNEREDFVDKLAEDLMETSIRKIAEKLPIDAIIDILTNRCDDSTAKLPFNKILERHSQNVPNEEKSSKELAVLTEYLCDRFDGRSLILFCSKLLEKVYDTSTKET